MNNNDKTVFGIGFIGDGPYKLRTKAYYAWSAMIMRCYRPKTGHISYAECIMDHSWFNYQVFAEWFEQNYVEGWEIDKDILKKGNKLYSPETCCFVPHQINTLFVKRNSLRGNYPIGVSYNKNRNTLCAQLIKFGKQKHIGIFRDVNLAFQAYKKAKEEYIIEVANLWKDKISHKLYEALTNYQVEITD
jgi:hypothetical protein